MVLPNNGDGEDSPAPPPIAPIGDDRKKKNDDFVTKLGGKWGIIALAISVAIGVYLYCYVTACPEKSPVILNEWWGTYPKDEVADTSIVPYEIEFSDVIINDLKERLLHRRPFPPPLQNAGFKYGFNTGFITRVLDFWQNGYDFKERERYLNKYTQYMTKIQGLDIHYIHVKPKVSSDIAVIPILLIHSWPSSIREFYEIIPLLTTSRADQNFVFEVIVPSLPGFGFSQAPVRAGMGPIETAVILNNLMNRIGHSEYYIHGGGLGHAIGSALSTIFYDNILGFHCNMPIVVGNPFVMMNVFIGSFIPKWFYDPEVYGRVYPLSDHATVQYEEYAYFYMQATKPDTIGIGLSESPAGLAAYILEKFSTWTNLANRNTSDGGLLAGKLSLTQLLDNVMIYWLTNSITTSMRHYIKYLPQMYLLDQIETTVPTAGIRFRHEFPYVFDFLLNKKYVNYIRSTNVDDGGQFPAMEMPQVLADDMFESVAEFRKFHVRPKSWWASWIVKDKKNKGAEKNKEKKEIKEEKEIKKQENVKEEKEIKKQENLKEEKEIKKQENMKEEKEIKKQENMKEEKEIKKQDEIEEEEEQNMKQKQEPESQQNRQEPEAKKTVYDFIVKDINGENVSLEKYKGKVLIIVNVASQCGYTDTHYTQLNELYDKYSAKGLRILAFPCNQFGGQEPGSLNEILKFTQKRNVKFDIFEKINVNGENTHPLWEFLKEAQSGTFGNFIKWNFSKFIIDRNGVPVERFGPNVNPVDLEPYLAKYW